MTNDLRTDVCLIDIFHPICQKRVRHNQQIQLQDQFPFFSCILRRKPTDLIPFAAIRVKFPHYGRLYGVARRRKIKYEKESEVLDSSECEANEVLYTYLCFETPVRESRRNQGARDRSIVESLPCGQEIHLACSVAKPFQVKTWLLTPSAVGSSSYRAIVSLREEGLPWSSHSGGRRRAQKVE